ncbi:MAG: putative toxin-antitoxin system toxin component, PIN family [Planctomycetota bacterium]
MATERRTVFDANVVVSALLLPRSVPRQAFDKAHDQGKLLVSAETVAELDDVLRREKFNKYLPEDERLEFLAALVADAESVEVDCVIIDCRDPKDNKYLELAVSGKAGVIVSGDPDLLALHPFRGIAILTPRDFLTGDM